MKISTQFIKGIFVSLGMLVLLAPLTVLACALFASPIYAAAKAKPSPETPQREQLTIALEEARKPWTGDLDGMIERGVIRILTVNSKTFYFVYKGTQRGASYDFGRLFEVDLNKKLAKDVPASYS